MTNPDAGRWIQPSDRAFPTNSAGGSSVKPLAAARATSAQTSASRQSSDSMHASRCGGDRRSHGAASRSRSTIAARSATAPSL